VIAVCSNSESTNMNRECHAAADCFRRCRDMMGYNTTDTVLLTFSMSPIVHAITIRLLTLF